MMRALLPIAIALAACSNSSTQPDGGVSFPEDAASGPQPVGAPCNPAIASPASRPATTASASTATRTRTSARSTSPTQAPVQRERHPLHDQ